MQLVEGPWRYTFTRDDVLWAARMLQGEGPPEDSAAILWTMAQLFAPEGQAGKYSGPHRFDTFTKLIQAYSQPINPIWRRDGSRCRPGGRYYGTDHCSEARLRRRDYYATLAYDDVDPDKRAVLEAWLEGKVPNPVPGAADFADRRVISNERRAAQPVIWTSPSDNQFLRAVQPIRVPVAVVSSPSNILDALTPFAERLRRWLAP